MKKYKLEQAMTMKQAQDIIDAYAAKGWTVKTLEIDDLGTYIIVFEL